ncbi:Ig-like domain-containing protein [Vagococcus silagei]|uniref:LPXTG cell wall anchor domain-containing protein n=1 Tax=Vagococcus silagei TaxID=2508885 RepID=A0A4S3B2J3_9ENTE|nr:Ig-like domain-containing protein [Vagococcus silagei]THB61364.1 LPXTG cell wall anchor domain-containing protein [Vagococcus silagei]
MKKNQVITTGIILSLFTLSSLASTSAIVFADSTSTTTNTTEVKPTNTTETKPTTTETKPIKEIITLPNSGSVLVNYQAGQKASPADFKNGLEEIHNLKFIELKFKDGLTPITDKSGVKTIELIGTINSGQQYLMPANYSVTVTNTELNISNVAYNFNTQTLSGTTKPGAAVSIVGKDGGNGIVDADKNGDFSISAPAKAGDIIYITASDSTGVGEKFTFVVPKPEPIIDPVKPTTTNTTKPITTTPTKKLPQTGEKATHFTLLGISLISTALGMSILLKKP